MPKRYSFKSLTVTSEDLTPYAILLARPLDSDKTIQQLFHALAERLHPDKAKAAYKAEAWHPVVEAYNLIKTEGLRALWARQRQLMAAICKECDGYGVKGLRVAGGKIKICAICNGSGILSGKGGKQNGTQREPENVASRFAKRRV